MSLNANKVQNLQQMTYNNGMKKKKEWLSQETKLLAAEIVLFAPATIFWLCALIYVGMETDYLFDAIIIPASQYVAGKLLISLAIIILPAAGSGIGYLMRKSHNSKTGTAMMILGGIYAIAGLICSFIKF